MADVFTYFEDLHKMPEIGMHEFKTSAYIADHLKKMDMKYRNTSAAALGLSLSMTAVNRDRFLAFALIWTH